MILLIIQTEGNTGEDTEGTQGEGNYCSQVSATLHESGSSVVKQWAGYPEVEVSIPAQS